MPEVSPVARALARDMLRHEAGGHAEPAALAEAAKRADARLRGRLGGLIGPTGYAILVTRAVRLVQAEVPALACVTVATGDDQALGVLHGVGEFVRANDAAGAAEAGLIAILAHVIGLLITFIGEDLALRLVRDAWPELAGQSESEEQA